MIFVQFDIFFRLIYPYYIKNQDFFIIFFVIFYGEQQKSVIYQQKKAFFYLSIVPEQGNVKSFSEV